MSQEAGTRIPKTINGFEIVERVGQGAMGAVFKARQVSLDRIVALKVLPPSIAADKTFIERFMREARSSAKLNHSHIVQGIDVGQDPESKLYYFAMEFVDGPTLKEILKDTGKFDELRALEVVRDVAKALEAADKVNIVHRDIKPDNILIAADGTPKLADLGLAKQITDDEEEEEAGLTQTGKAVGTPHYMAPEQVRGQGDEIDIRTDLYALGATFFHLVTGQPPFKGETAAVIMAAHLNEKPPLAHRVEKDVSEGTGRLIAKLMEKDKKRRVQTPTELIQQIEKLLGALGGRRPAKTAATTGKQAPIRPAGTTGPRAPVRATTGPRQPVRAVTTGPRAAVSGRADTGAVAQKKSPVLAIVGGVAALLLVGAFALMGGGKPTEPRRTENPPREMREDRTESNAKPAVSRVDPPAPAPAGKTVDPEAEPAPREVQPAQPPAKLNAMDAFVELRKFEGLAADDAKGQAERIKAFLAEYGDTDEAIRARQMLALLNLDEEPAPGEPAMAAVEPKPAEAGPPETAAPQPPDEAQKKPDLAAAEAAFASFAADYMRLLREGHGDEAQLSLSKARANEALQALAAEVETAKEALAWQKALDESVGRGAEKLKELGVFQLRLASGSSMRIGTKVDMQVTDVKNETLYVKQEGMELPVPFAKLHAQTRGELAELGLPEGAEGVLPRLLAKVLALSGGESDLTAAQVRASLSQARDGGAATEALSFLGRLTDVAEKGAAEASASAAYALLQRLDQEQKWKELKEAALKFQAAHGGSALGREKEADVQRMLAQATDQVALLEGLSFDFNTPQSYADFQQAFKVREDGSHSGQGRRKGNLKLESGKLRAVFVEEANGPRSWMVSPLELRMPERTWDGDWELRLTLRNVYPPAQGGNKPPDATLNLVFDWAEGRGGSGFHFRDSNFYNRVYAEFLSKAQSGFPSETGIWRLRGNEAGSLKRAGAYALRWVRQGKQLSFFLDGKLALEGAIPDEVAGLAASNPVRLAFSAGLGDEHGLELDDLYFGPVRGAAPAPPPPPVQEPPAQVADVGKKEDEKPEKQPEKSVSPFVKAEAQPMVPTRDLNMWLSFDEGRGNRPIDKAHHGFDGVIVGAGTYDEGRWGKAMRLDGQAQIGLNNPRGLRMGGNSFSLSAWVNTQSGGTLVSKAPLDGKWAAFSKAWYIGGDGRLGFTSSGAPDGVGNPTGKTRLTDGRWHHVALTYDWNTRELALWVDGEKEHSSNPSLSPDVVQHVVRVGYGSKTTPNPSGFKGLLDEVIHYSRGLSADEVKALGAQLDNPPPAQSEPPKENPGPAKDGQGAATPRSAPDGPGKKLDEAFAASVRGLPPEEQAQKVLEKLRSANPSIEDRRNTHRVEGDAVTEFRLIADELPDLTPLQALPALKRLFLTGRGQPAALDLAALSGLKLERLDIHNFTFADLAPLAGMPLTELHFHRVPIADLGALKFDGLKLLDLVYTQVTDLGPLKGLKIENLNLDGSPVANLKPLEGMALANLTLNKTQVTDLSPLKGMPLQRLNLFKAPVTDLGPLAGMNGLKFLNLQETGVTSLAALKGLAQLEDLDLGRTGVQDLSPLKGLPLKRLQINNTGVASLAPMQGAPLQFLDANNSSVQDLGPLKGAPLDWLNVESTPVMDLAPLAGLPLKDLRIQRTGVSSLKPVAGAPLRNLTLEAAADPKGEVLRQLKDLQRINGKRPGEYFRDMAGEGRKR
ncbi:MAG: protein kinase [Planctomycetota bacterium]|nr:protein kinase [Planctomycetota bacterium]